MEDVIVLILTLIFIAASFFGQAKKRKQSPETSVKNSNSSIHEDFSRKALGLEKEEYETDESKVESSKIIPSKEDSSIDRFHTRENKMRREFLPKKRNETPITVATFNKKKSPFPLKKAIIYSEILNRKYF